MKVAVLGECMIELCHKSDDQYKMGFGGDTLNTAIYLCRCNGEADYFSVLGDDPYSLNMLDAWRSEGVGINHVRIKENKLPGLYIINNDEDGERYFNYWRQNSPARTMLSDYPVILDEIKSYEMIFLSGITLSLYPQDDLIALFNCLSQYRKEGGIVIFDNNYRINNWMDTNDAIEAFTKMMSLTDIALLSFDDEKALYGAHSIEDCITRWVDSGSSEVVVKNGHRGCHFYKDKTCTFYPLETVLTPVDTTAAGDSFNGAYIAAKLQGQNDEACIKAGQQCASTVIMHQGAIINRDICLLSGDL